MIIDLNITPPEEGITEGVPNPTLEGEDDGNKRDESGKIVGEINSPMKVVHSENKKNEELPPSNDEMITNSRKASIDIGDTRMCSKLGEGDDAKLTSRRARGRGRTRGRGGGKGRYGGRSTVGKQNISSLISGDSSGSQHDVGEELNNVYASTRKRYKTKQAPLINQRQRGNCEVVLALPASNSKEYMLTVWRKRRQSELRSDLPNKDLAEIDKSENMLTIGRKRQQRELPGDLPNRGSNVKELFFYFLQLINDDVKSNNGTNDIFPPSRVTTNIAPRRGRGRPRGRFGGKGRVVLKLGFENQAEEESYTIEYLVMPVRTTMILVRM